MCLVVLASFISPRLGIFLLQLFSDRPSQAFDSFWIGLFGFLFLPWTTLAWIICYSWPKGVSGFGWFVVLFMFFVDLASYGSGAREQRRRQQAGY